METKWTPGPWEVGFDRRGVARVFAGQHEVVRALSEHGTRRLSHDERFANRHLIAAAPDLYRELDMQVRNCPLCKGEGMAVDAFTFLREGSNGKKSDCSRCRPARAALAKARGETQ